MSPASRSHHRWQRFLVYVETEDLNQTIADIVRSISNSNIKDIAVIGERYLLDDDTSMVMEVSNPAAVLQVSHLLQGAIIISNSKVVISTFKAKDMWAQLMTDFIEQDNPHSISNIRDRKGRIWAKPLLLQDVIDETARARRGAIVPDLPAGSETLTPKLSYLRFLNYPKTIQERKMSTLMNNVIRALHADGGIAIRWSAPDDINTRVIWPSVWETRAQGEACKWNGMITMQLQESSEHEVVFKALDGTAMQILGRMTTVKVNNNMGIQFVHMVSIADTPSASSGS